jgi:N-acetylglutamate synthase-like GNAT family acetyltransferase
METVRIATRADEPEIIRLLKIMHAEGGMLPLSIPRAREMFNRAFDKTGGIIGVIGPKNDIKAMIFLNISHYWYTDECHVEEIYNFVRQDHRKSEYAKDLINFAKDCADKLKMPLVIGVLTNQRMESKVRLYRRILGTPVGAFFVYGANWVNLELSNDDFWKSLFKKKSD